MAPLDLRIYKQTVQGMRWLHELVDEAGLAVIPQQPTGAQASALSRSTHPPR